MALIKCSKCGNQVSTKAEKCPKCGYLVNKSMLKKARNMTIALSVIIVAIVCCVNVYYYFDTDHVPDYAGQQYDKVIKEISEFNIKCKKVSSNDVPEGEIISQKNEYNGRKIKQIVFTVSAGNTITMPNLIGMNVQEAVDELNNLGIYNIELQKSDKRKNTSFSDDDVCFQSVKGGNEIGVEENVVLKTYADNYKIIPDMEGKTVTSANKELRDLGFDYIIYDSGANAQSKISDIEDADSNSIIGKIYYMHDKVYLKVEK